MKLVKITKTSGASLIVNSTLIKRVTVRGSGAKVVFNGIVIDVQESVVAIQSLLSLEDVSSVFSVLVGNISGTKITPISVAFNIDSVESIMQNREASGSVIKALNEQYYTHFTPAIIWELISIKATVDIQDITFLDSRKLATDGKLIPGQRYSIQDYKTKQSLRFTSGDAWYQHEGPTEPLVVTAATGSTFHRVAYSPAYPNDIIHYLATSVLCEDGVTPKPGVITKRIDTARNIETPFDFRNAKWIRREMHAPAWDGLSTYSYRNLVEHNGIIYKAKQNVPAGTYEEEEYIGYEPGTEHFYWIIWCDNTLPFKAFARTDYGDSPPGYANTVLTYSNEVVVPTFTTEAGADGISRVQNLRAIGSNNVFIVSAARLINGVIIESGSNNTIYGAMTNVRAGFGFNGNIFYRGNTADCDIASLFSSNVVADGFYWNQTSVSFMGNTIAESCWYNNFAVEFVYNCISGNFGNNKTGIDTFHFRAGFECWDNELGYYIANTSLGNFSRGNRFAGNIANCILPQCQGVIFEHAMSNKDLTSHATALASGYAKIVRGATDKFFISQRNASGVEGLTAIT